MLKSIIDRALRAAHISYHSSAERRNYRLWLNIDGPGDRHDSLAKLEASLGGFHLGGSVSLVDDCEGGLEIRLGLGPVQLFIGSEHKAMLGLAQRLAPFMPKDYYQRAKARVGAELYAVDGDLVARLHLLTNDDASTGPSNYYNIKDILLGGTDYHPKRGKPEMRTMYLAEGAYEIKLERDLSTWTRPRWPFPTRSSSYHWEVVRGPQGASTSGRQVGVPIPGKGENSYDCDDDAVFGGSITGYDADDALGNILAMVMHDRTRRASPSWTPSSRAEQAVG